jgi:glutathione synthase/RimK-type ligase-like ATP-grasp enzyme
MRPIAIFHEHPDWFRPLFAELDRRGVPYVRLDAASHHYDPAEPTTPYALVFNRASPSAYLRGHRQSTFYTLQWFRHLERLGVPVVNGTSAYQMDISKALQLDAFEVLGLPYPRTLVANSAAGVVEAAGGLRFPVLVKANVGGSGAGIERYDDLTLLEEAATADALDLGVDGVALVQEMAPLRGGHITRVEVLGGRFLYAINVFPAPDSLFNLCPADVCQTTDGRALSRSACALDAPKTGLRVERADPPASIVAEVEQVARQVGLDVGGIEYLVDDRDGHHYFYDVNALSNFVADARHVLGFDPHERLVDYLVARATESDAVVIDPRERTRSVAPSTIPVAEARIAAVSAEEWGRA